MRNFQVRRIRLLTICSFLIMALHGEAQDENNFYTVKPGDTLVVIALRLYGNANRWEKIAADNHVLAPYVLHTGQKIKLAPATISIQKGNRFVVSYWRNILGRQKNPTYADSKSLRQTASDTETSAPTTSQPAPTIETPPTPVAEAAPEVHWPPLARRSFRLGTSYYSDALTQTGLSNFSFQGLQIEAGAKTYLPESNFYAELLADYGLIGWGNTLANFSASVLDIELRLGHRFDVGSERFSLSPFLDGRFTTMFVTANAFGYQNVFEGGLGLEAAYRLCPHLDLSASGSFDFAHQFNFSNRQIDAQVALQYRFDEVDGLRLIGSWSHFQINDTDAASTSTLRTFKIGLNYVLLLP